VIDGLIHGFIHGLSLGSIREWFHGSIEVLLTLNGPPRRRKPMFWQEEPEELPGEVPTDVVDVLFAVDCKQLPVDHAYALSRALAQALPWFEEEPGLGVHTIHVAGSQNGWERPAHGTQSHILLSRRTKLALRVPQARVEPLVRALRGQTLDIAGCPLTLGDAKPRSLSKETTLFARYLITRPEEGEDAFLTRMAEELATLDIRIRKALCGKTLSLAIPRGTLATRSLLLADLSPEESIRLQQRGLGTHRTMGCGLFIPHKGIDSVRKTG